MHLPKHLKPMKEFHTITSVRRTSAFNGNIEVKGTSKKGNPQTILMSGGKSDENIAQTIYFIKNHKAFVGDDDCEYVLK